MTMQVEDGFSHDRRPYTISAFTGRGIFRPQDHGLSPRMLSTGCRRGFQCRYSAEDDRLCLRHLVIGVEEPMRLLGSMPLPNGGAPWQTYEDLPDPVSFTGGILAGPGVQSGGGTPVDRWAIRSRLPFRLLIGLHELTFEEGRLLAAAPRWAAAGEFAERVRLGGGVPQGEIEAWLGAVFTERGYVDYERWLYGDV